MFALTPFSTRTPIPVLFAPHSIRGAKSTKEGTRVSRDRKPLKSYGLLMALWVSQSRRVNVSRETLPLWLERPMTKLLGITKGVEQENGFLNILFLDDHMQLARQVKKIFSFGMPCLIGVHGHFFSCLKKGGNFFEFRQFTGIS